MPVEEYPPYPDRGRDGDGVRRDKRVNSEGETEVRNFEMEQALNAILEEVRTIRELLAEIVMGD